MSSSAGFAISLAYFGGSLIAAGFAIMFLDPAVTEMLTFVADEYQRQYVHDGAYWVDIAWTGAGLIALIIGMVMIIAKAAFLSEGAGGRQPR